MLDQPEQVHTAVAQAPKLHRFINLLPGWVIEAARLVCSRYAGNAGAIWNDQPTARALFDRLDAFPGIGQKKAAMAVEILERDLSVPIREVSGSDIAYDIHVRRVFLRTGLAEHDDLDHMRQVARTLHPQRPGALDLPAWLIGRQWCRAGHPECTSCPLAGSCPKLLHRAQNVHGA